MISQHDNGQEWQLYSLTVLGGVLLGAAFPPGPTGVLAWFSMAPIFYAALHARSDRHAFWMVLAGFVVANSLAFPWPWRHPILGLAVAGSSVWLLLAMIPAAVLAWARRVDDGMGRPAAIVACVSGFLAAEAALTHTPLAIPWALLGHTQAETEVLWGAAAYIGVEGLSALLLIWSALLVAILDVRSIRTKTVLALGLALSMMIPLLIPVPSTPEGGEGLEASIAIVQPGLGPLEWANDDRLRRGTLESLSADLAMPNELIALVWPEAATRESDTWAGQPLIAGLIESGPPANSIALNGRSVYQKRRLVPFIEAVPGELSVPWLGRLRLDPNGYRPGTGSPRINLGGHSIGLAICFETLFAAHFTELEGTRLNIAVTQDGWWQSRRAAWQHLVFSRFRALETGTPLAVASVNGFSAVIRPDGHFQWQSRWDEASAEVVSVPANRPPTYRRDWVAVPAVTIFLVLAFIIFRRNRRSSTRPKSH
ncbi:apolipoprotein N-acyltransferase [Rhodothermus sp. AH-315-K08]|nr:apolipoprotein N-acyltransferase [Rhodothermus sp. AH-315-K08]